MGFGGVCGPGFGWIVLKRIGVVGRGRLEDGLSQLLLGVSRFFGDGVLHANLLGLRPFVDEGDKYSAIAAIISTADLVGVSKLLSENTGLFV